MLLYFSVTEAQTFIADGKSGFNTLALLRRLWFILDLTHIESPAWLHDENISICLIFFKHNVCRDVIVKALPAACKSACLQHIVIACQMAMAIGK